VSNHERAIYAILGGVLSQNIFNLKPAVLLTWEDHLWAHYKLLMSYKTDQILEFMKDHMNLDVEAPEPEDYSPMDETQIFSLLKTQFPFQSGTLQGQVSIYRHIQEQIILGEIDRVFNDIRTKFLPDKEPIDITDEELGRFGPGILRFYAHLVLFFHPNGFSNLDDLDELSETKQDIILFYWMHLFRSCSHYNNSKIELITSYSSKLSTEQQIRYHSEFFQRVQTEEERRACIRVATEWEMDLPNITYDTVMSTLDRPVKATKDVREAEEADLERIRVVEWYHLSNQTQRAVQQVCALASQFIQEKKVDAARTLYVRYEFSNDLQFPIMGRYDSIRNFLKCSKSYQDIILPKNGREVSVEELNQVKEDLYSILFDQNFLAAVQDENEEDRLQLQQHCVPQLYFYLHFVLFKLENFDECLQLLIKLEEEDIRYFQAEEREQMLEKTRRTYFEIAKDPRYRWIIED